VQVVVESCQRCRELVDERRVPESFLEHPEAMPEVSQPPWSE
jgi:hypothetical protein